MWVIARDSCGFTVKLPPPVGALTVSLDKAIFQVIVLKRACGYTYLAEEVLIVFAKKANDGVAA